MAMQQTFNRAYLIHGEGGIQSVQARLADHGLCSFTKWDPGPPRWRFTYETNLAKADLEAVLHDLLKRYDVKIEIKGAPL